MASEFYRRPDREPFKQRRRCCRKPTTLWAALTKLHQQLAIMPGQTINVYMTVAVAPSDPADVFLQRLPELCEAVAFASGAILRRHGQHHATMYLVTSERVEVDLGSAGNKPAAASARYGVPHLCESAISTASLRCSGTTWRSASATPAKNSYAARTGTPTP
jgi:hypothetical protein